MLRTLGLYLLDVLVIKTLIILITLPTNLQSQIEIQTLDSYEIQSVDTDTLIVTRVSESSDSHLSFLMYRPFCICSDLSFAIFNTETDLEIGDKLQGKMVIDLRSKPVTYYVEHKTDKMLLLTVLSFPSIRNSRLIEIKTEFIHESYLTQGLEDVMQQTKDMCQSFIPFEEIDEDSKTKFEIKV